MSAPIALSHFKRLLCERHLSYVHVLVQSKWSIAVARCYDVTRDRYIKLWCKRGLGRTRIPWCSALTVKLSCSPIRRRTLTHRNSKLGRDPETVSRLQRMHSRLLPGDQLFVNLDRSVPRVYRDNSERYRNDICTRIIKKLDQKSVRSCSSSLRVPKQG